jgi:hypothetical protein
MVNNEDAASADSDNSWERREDLTGSSGPAPRYRHTVQTTRRSAGDSLAEELAEETAIHKLCPCGDEPES